MIIIYLKSNELVALWLSGTGCLSLCFFQNFVKPQKNSICYLISVCPNKTIEVEFLLFALSLFIRSESQLCSKKVLWCKLEAQNRNPCLKVQKIEKMGSTILFEKLQYFRGSCRII